MKELQNRAKSTLGRDYSETKLCGDNKLAVDFYFPEEETVVDRFAEPEYSCEFEDIEIAIDRSFVHRDEHRVFWKEWLRNDLMKSSRIGTIKTIKEWPPDHPFKRKYRIHKGLVDYNDLFHKHTESFSFGFSATRGGGGQGTTR